MIFKRRPLLALKSVQKVTFQPRHLSFLTLQRGNAVRDALRHTSCRAAHSREDAERPERRTHAGAWARWCSPGHLSSRTLQPRHLSLLTLQRGNAVRDALRHTICSASPCRNASAITRLSCR
ncbi:DUF1534 domain-containing protein [Pseudomonas congelans]|nr:DUF1534 domain-containing protein [Pseudomonas congelans]